MFHSQAERTLSVPDTKIWRGVCLFSDTDQFPSLRQARVSLTSTRQGPHEASVATDVNHVVTEFLSDLIDGIEHVGPFLALGEKRELELAFVDKV